MNIKENVPLAPFTTFRIGGAARYFCTAKSEADVIEAIRFAREKDVPLFVLGGGSNLLVADDGFAGLVMKMEVGGMRFVEAAGSVMAEAGAGENWDALVAASVERGYWGLENLSAIPGTVGAAPVQNIGAYGVEVGGLVGSLRAVNVATGATREFSNAECRFGYRESFFKTEEGRRWIITLVRFDLFREPRPNLSYHDLAGRFTGIVASSLSDIRDAVVAIRAGKFPNLGEIGTAGSFWKNPTVSPERFAELSARYPGLPSFPTPSDIAAGPARVKIPLAWILDQVCGLKGFSMGRVTLWKSQPLVMVAERGAIAAEVKKLADRVAREVKEKTGIDIEPEVRTLG
jgi:UDP-N-acetylmuramate dehydrogenase